MLLLDVFCIAPVFSLVSVTSAPQISAPCTSATVPLIWVTVVPELWLEESPPKDKIPGMLLASSAA